MNKFSYLRTSSQAIHLFIEISLILIHRRTLSSFLQCNSLLTICLCVLWWFDFKNDVPLYRGSYIILESSLNSPSKHINTITLNMTIKLSLNAYLTSTINLAINIEIMPTTISRLIAPQYTLSMP